MMRQKKPALQYCTTRAERLSYWMYFLGENIFYGLIAINMQTFYSDVGITAASVAVILFITKAWDAVNDPLFGALIDRVNFKKGRFMPWLRLAMPLLAVSSIFFFALPGGAGPAVKVIWATVAYMAWDASYTLCDVPMFVLPTSMTDNIKERGQLLTMGRYFAMIGVTGASMLLPMVQKRLGWLAGYDNLGLFYALYFVQGIFWGANNILLFTFTPDCLEYGTYHTGERAEGVAASVQTFFSKLVGSLSGPFAMLILAGCGFVAGEGAAQPQAALNGIWICFSLLPSVGMLLSAGLLYFYKLRDRDVQVMAQYNDGQITRDEADARLAKRYGPAAPRQSAGQAGQE